MATMDIGLETVDNLFKDLMIDDQWSVREDRGFTWWAHGLAQHIEADEPTIVGDRKVCAVRVWTEVANSVDPGCAPAAIVAIANLSQTLSALTWDPMRRTITESCSVTVHSGNMGWLRQVLLVAAVMQNRDAHDRASAIADAVGGTPAVSSHPVSGERIEMDEMIVGPPQVLAQSGSKKSKFAGGFTRRLENLAKQLGLVGFASPTEFSCELPFTGSMSVAVLQDDCTAETSLLQIFAEQHPVYGHGALIALSLPIRFGTKNVVEVANRLNLMEFTGDAAAFCRGADANGQVVGHLGSGQLGMFLGAWCSDPREKAGDRIAFTAFLPSALAKSGLLENFVIYQVVRSRLAARILVDEQTPQEKNLRLEREIDTAFWAVVASLGKVDFPDPFGRKADGDPVGEDGQHKNEATTDTESVLKSFRVAAAQAGTLPVTMHSVAWQTAVTSRFARWHHPPGWQDEAHDGT